MGGVLAIAHRSKRKRRHLKAPPLNEANPAYGTLCDAIASDKLLCVTGAGISASMERRDGTKLPQWRDLLLAILDSMGTTIDPETRRACRKLLAVKPPDGEMLIEAASLLERPDPSRFATMFKRQVTPRAGQPSDTHRAIVALKPRGVLTFNYDAGHESAWREKGRRDRPQVLLAYDEALLANVIRTGCRFILKAHGSLDSLKPLVLTYAAYRDLLAKQPAYRAFLHHLLTNFQMMIVGFSGIDPDFNLLMNTLIEEFGAPLHRHVIIRKYDRSSDWKRAQALALLMERRHGIETLWVSDFKVIPQLLTRALETPGPQLQATLDQAVYGGDTKDRNAAHVRFRALGEAGHECAQRYLRQLLDRPHIDANAFYTSEVMYSLGVLDEKGNKALLMDLVEREIRRGRADPPARALTVLRGALRKSDIPRLKRWLPITTNLKDDPEARVEAYIRYLIVYVKHRWNSDLSHPKKQRL